MLLPALSAAKSRAYQAQCVSNLKQLQLGWVMYAGDNNDAMMPNSPSTSSGVSWVGNNPENWGNNNANTNVALYQTNLMASYMTAQLGVYRCPADNVPSDNGQRIRTYSMQGQVGSTLAYGNQTYARSYLKLGNITGDPGASDLIVFLEESGVDLGSPSTMDGWLQVDNAFGPTAGSYSGQAYYPDLPGAYHKWSCGFSFADGHSEIHKWVDPGLKIAVTAHMPLPANYSSGKGLQIGNPVGSTATDWRWFTEHCTSHK